MNQIEQLKNLFPELFIDAFLITDEINMQYLTNFGLTQGDGCVLVTASETYIITDARFEEALNETNLGDVKVRITRDYFGAVNTLCGALGLETIGIEDTVSLRIYDALVNQLDADIDAMDDVIETLRSVKSSSEIMRLTASAELSSAGFEYLTQAIHVGMSELEVANLLDAWMKQQGAQKSSFDTIVASGINAAKPHATASDKIIQSGDSVVLDFGYFLDNYTSDITRTVVMGEASEQIKEIYGVVLAASQAVITTAKAGANGQELDAAGRNIIDQAGYSQQFNHGMGHGIGMSVHELPASYGPNSSLKLKSNQIITVEPGIYLPNLGGVRIEDDILITENGHEVLTTANKELLIL